MGPGTEHVILLGLVGADFLSPRAHALVSADVGCFMIRTNKMHARITYHRAAPSRAPEPYQELGPESEPSWQLLLSWPLEQALWPHKLHPTTLKQNRRMKLLRWHWPKQLHHPTMPKQPRALHRPQWTSPAASAWLSAQRLEHMCP
jgi:hypothetical protein